MVKEKEYVPPFPKLGELIVGRFPFRVESPVTVWVAWPSFLQTTALPFTVALNEAGLKRQLASLGLHVPSSCKMTLALVVVFWVRM